MCGHNKSTLVLTIVVKDKLNYKKTNRNIAVFTKVASSLKLS
jgi:hypothetical protein